MLAIALGALTSMFTGTSSAALAAVEGQEDGARSQLGFSLRADVIEFGLGATLSGRARGLLGLFPGVGGGPSLAVDSALEVFIGGVSDTGLFSRRSGGAVFGASAELGVVAGGYLPASSALQYGVHARGGVAAAVAARPSLDGDVQVNVFGQLGLAVSRYHLATAEEGSVGLVLALPLDGSDWGYLALQFMF